MDSKILEGKWAIIQGKTAYLTNCLDFLANITVS